MCKVKFTHWINVIIRREPKNDDIGFCANVNDIEQKTLDVIQYSMECIKTKFILKIIISNSL